MNNIITLLKLEIKDSSIGGFKPKEYKSWLKAIFQIAILCFVGYVVFFGSKVFFSMFKAAGITYEALVLFFTLVFIVLVFSGTSGVVKCLYHKGDNEILMRYPVQAHEIFISKILFLLVRQIFITAIIVAPFLVGYSKVESLPGAFHYRIPIVLFFLVSIPFLLANIFAIPTMHITNKIRNKFILIIISLAVIVTLSFLAYMWVFNKMVEYMKEQSFSVFDNEIVDKISAACRYLYPKFFADILVGEKPYLAYPWAIGTVGTGLAITIIIITTLYHKTLLTNIEIEGSAFRRKTKNRVKPIFITLLNKEFIQVFRSVNYSFQYFVLACAMPGMVFFSNSIVQNLAKQQVGDRMIFGVTLLVMLVFMTIITSFAATTISREGASFYLTKTSPVNIRTQLYAKLTMYIIVSFLSNLISMVIIAATKHMSVQYAIITFVIVQLNATSLTLIAMRTDIDRPAFNLVGDGGEIQSNNVNTTRSVGLGLAVALFLGMLGMIFGGNLKLILAIIASLSIAFFIYAILRYEINLRKKYYLINN